jgi:hypothetical protein
MCQDDKRRLWLEEKVFLFLKIYIPKHLNDISLTGSLVYMQKQTYE